jgi:tetratricopeptide (TPR) repeat protein
MRKIIPFIIAVFVYPELYGQSVAALYDHKEYEALTKLEDKANTLTGEELYLVGFAFFQMENDNKAVSFYDKAIAKGFDNAPTHFYKGVALTFLRKYKEALTEVDIALKKEPNNQEYMNQKGLIYKYQGNEDKALDYFEEATRFPNTFGEPFFWVAYIYHGKQNYEKALKLYYVAAAKVPKQNTYYVNTLLCIGQLEYTFTQNYQKSAKAYAEAIALRPKDYDNYPKLIKAYNAAKEYAKADAVFDLLKTAYKNNELSKELTKSKTVAVDEFVWNKQRLMVYKSLEDPKEVLDVSYTINLLTQAGDKVARKFTVEKTIQVANGFRHLFCEVKEDAHFTYPCGWKTDAIALEDVKKAITQVLEGSLQKSATEK